MLDEKTLEWLERRKNLCTHCGRREWCRTGNKHNYNTDQCRFWEPFAWQISDHITIHDFRDVAEFEARVAKKLCDPFWNFAIAEQYFQLALPYRRLPAAFVLKHARLEVEAEMIAEGKGPSGRMGKDNGN